MTKNNAKSLSPLCRFFVQKQIIPYLARLVVNLSRIVAKTGQRLFYCLPVSVLMLNFAALI